MLYQETFQSGENPSEISVSSYIYINGKLEDNMITVGFPDHCHSYFEIQYFFSGSGETRIDGKPIRTVPNSLYLIPPLHVHGQSGHERMVNLVIQFSHNFLSSNAFAWKKNSTLLPAGEMKKNGIIMVEPGSRLSRYIAEIEEISPRFETWLPESEKKFEYTVEYEWKLHSATLGIITELLDTGNLVISENAGDVSETIRLHAVLNHLVTHPEEKLGMEKAAKLACMSYSNFSRAFKEAIGRSYVDYCNSLRVRRAEELLKTTKISVTNISQMLGFGSVSYFNRIFRTYTGSTPMQYRKESM